MATAVGGGHGAAPPAAAVPVEPAGCAGAPDAAAGAGRGHRGVPRSRVRRRHHPGDRGRGESVRPAGGGTVRPQGPAPQARNPPSPPHPRPTTGLPPPPPAPPPTPP